MIVRMFEVQLQIHIRRVEQTTPSKKLQIFQESLATDLNLLTIKLS